VRLNASDPELDRSSSELAGELNFYPNERVSVRSNLQYDPSTRKMNAGNLMASYTEDATRWFNVGYTFRRPVALVGNQPVTDQVNLSTYYPINNNWRFFMAWSYSLEAERSVEDMLGIEYDSCCWQVRLLHLRYFDTVRDRIPDFDSRPGPRIRHAGAVRAQGPRRFRRRGGALLGDMIRGFNRLARLPDSIDLSAPRCCWRVAAVGRGRSHGDARPGGRRRRRRRRHGQRAARARAPRSPRALRVGAELPPEDELIREVLDRLILESIQLQMGSASACASRTRSSMPPWRASPAQNRMTPEQFAVRC
jgi:hypothetical protein